MIDDAPTFARIAPVPPAAARSRAIFGLLDRLTQADAPIFAAARSVIDWHARHGFCAASGHPTRVIRAGWGRHCDGCGADHFPRVDPVVIMLAEYQGDVLVGRQPGFPPGRYSALAGFVEPGESIEVDEHMRSTRFDWLYALGDVNGQVLLTHMGKYQAAICADIQKQALQTLPYIPMGQYLQPTAYRDSLQGVLNGFALFWNVKRA